MRIEIVGFVTKTFYLNMLCDFNPGNGNDTRVQYIFVLIMIKDCINLKINNSFSNL